MAKKKAAKTKHVSVGDRVRLRLGGNDVVAEVVEDHGGIGVTGRQMVAISVRAEDGEVERFDWPADELIVEPRDRAAV